MLGTAERFGAPSVFYTLFLDDVHQVLTVRLSFASESNARFTAFGSSAEDEEPGIASMLEALRSNGRFEFSDSKEIGFSEGMLQRLAADNPVATSAVFFRAVTVFLENLIGIPDEQNRRYSSAFLDCLGPEAPTARGSRRPGIFGVPIANTWVAECSG